SEERGDGRWMAHGLLRRLEDDAAEVALEHSRHAGAAPRRRSWTFLAPRRLDLCDLPVMADGRRLLLSVTAALAASLAAGGALAQPSAQPIADAVELRDADCLALGTLAAGIGRYLHREVLDARIHIAVRETPKGVAFTLSEGDHSWSNTYPIERGSCTER